MLIVFSGLPGVGKTAIARELARRIAAVHLRIDSIEQALHRAGCRVVGEGYDVAYAVAEDNLRVGRAVIADCVNPWLLTRGAWRSVAERAGVAALDVEIVCSDAAEHRRRVESREPDIAGHTLPIWPDVVSRDYHAWDRDRLVVDTTAWTSAPALVRSCADCPRGDDAGESAGPSEDSDARLAADCLAAFRRPVASSAVASRPALCPVTRITVRAGTSPLKRKGRMPRGTRPFRRPRVGEPRGFPGPCSRT